MVSRPIPDDLERLDRLDRRLLHVFVAGPGRGEGVAVALPERGWVVLDGCRVDDGSFPVDEILSRWKSVDDSLEVLVFTHPHDDHAAGIPRVIERHRPRRIAITVPAPPGPAVLAEVEARSRSAETTAEQLEAGAVRSALAAIRRWTAENPTRLLTACDGEFFETSGVRISFRAPDRAGLSELIARLASDPKVRVRANEISAVVEIQFGATCIVLGSDLPRLTSDGTSRVKTGWDEVLRRHGHLGRHHGLKIPHHGSRGAHHPELMTEPAAPSAREWWITPYNRSRLPRLAAGEGLDWLLQRQPRICLTALPAALSVQATAEVWSVPRDRLVRRLEAQATGQPFLDEGIELRPGSGCGPLDAVWCGAYDHGGELVGRWRGRAALEIIRAT